MNIQKHSPVPLAAILTLVLTGLAMPAFADSAICKSVDQNGVTHYRACKDSPSDKSNASKVDKIRTGSKQQPSRTSRYGAAVTHAGTPHMVKPHGARYAPSKNIPE